MVEQIDNTELMKEMSEQPSTPSKYVGLGATIAAELMIGFWFGTGLILAFGVVDGLNYCIGVLMSSGKNEITTKMSSNEVTTTKVEVPLQVTAKDPKKVAAGKKLAEWNCKNKEKLAQPDETRESEPKLSQAQSIGGC